MRRGVGVEVGDAEIIPIKIYMTSNKFANLLAVGGLLLMGASNCVFLVDPGEKALIMNNFTGLRAKVIGEGYHLRIPFVEVPPLPLRSPSSTTPASNPSTST